MTVTGSDRENSPVEPHPTPAESYLKYCAETQSPAHNYVLQALKIATVTGELCLAGSSLGPESVAGLASSLRNSTDVTALNLADCMVAPAALQRLIDSLKTASIRSLNLHGNNIGAQTTAKLGRFLAANRTVKTLNLKWNVLGLSVEPFAIFCNGLSQNITLEELDLRSNQLCFECAKHIGSALRINKTLTTLDLRWNNVHNEGAEALLRGLEENRSLAHLQLQGNGIHREVSLAIEECIRNHAVVLKSNADHEMRTSILLERIKVLESTKTSQLNEIKERTSTQLAEAETREEAHALAIQEKNSKLEELENALFLLRQEHKSLQQRAVTLETNLNERERVFKEFKSSQQSSMNKLRKEVEEDLQEDKVKLQYYEEQMNQSKSKMEDAQNLAERRSKENELLKKEAARHVDDIERMRVAMETERNSWQKKLEELDQSHEQHLQQTRSSAQEAQRRLEAALAQISERQSGEFFGMSERCERLKQEKINSEDRLSVLQNSLTQLQRENSNLIAQLAEPARKLTALLDELAEEKIQHQRTNQEKLEAIRLQKELSHEVETLREKLLASMGEMEQFNRSRVEEAKEFKSKLKQLQNKLDGKNKKIESLKKDESARNKILESAFSKYFEKCHAQSSKSSDDS